MLVRVQSRRIRTPRDSRPRRGDGGWGQNLKRRETSQRLLAGAERTRLVARRATGRGPFLPTTADDLSYPLDRESLEPSLPKTAHRNSPSSLSHSRTSGSRARQYDSPLRGGCPTRVFQCEGFLTPFPRRGFGIAKVQARRPRRPLSRLSASSQLITLNV